MAIPKMSTIPPGTIPASLVNPTAAPDAAVINPKAKVGHSWHSWIKSLSVSFIVLYLLFGGWPYFPVLCSFFQGALKNYTIQIQPRLSRSWLNLQSMKVRQIGVSRLMPINRNCQSCGKPDFDHQVASRP